MATLEYGTSVEDVREVLRLLSSPYLLRSYEATPEDYERITDEDVRCEYFDGVLVMHSPANLDHEDLVAFVITLLRMFIARGARGRVFGSNAVMQFGQRRFCPDLSMLKTANYGRVQGGRVMGPMDLAVEVLSKSTRDYDLREKRLAYREGGVPEVWFIDYEKREFHVDWRADGEAYRTELLKEGRWSSRVLPGFWVEVAWFWTDPLPDPAKSIERILAAPD